MTVPSDAPIVCEARNLSFRYGGLSVLEDITFHIHAGEYVGIVGPNGGGKTTLVKLLLGVLQPTKGSVLLFDSNPAERSVRLRVGYVPQRLMKKDPLFPATVEEIVRMGQARDGRRPTDADVEQSLSIVGVTDVRHRLIAGLSGGQMQRVLIARALVGKPEMLILDEPATAIDLPSRQQFSAFLRDLNEKHGITIILVTHDAEAIAKDVTSVLCVNGSLVAHGDASCLLDEQCFRKLYGEDMQHLHHHH